MTLKGVRSSFASTFNFVEIFSTILYCFFQLDAMDYLDSNLFDEFGNYIGEALDSDDEAEELGAQQEYASTSTKLPGYDEEDEEIPQDGDIAMGEDEALSGPSNAVVLHGWPL